ncbi:uncharacterized protein LOC123875067 isoform X1 [Maniola jurtina]|uniref:uncharacterized protein LOC123875067 isoform X1 n=1 Tax=Maniola jurtina TaxID=191418 RepID=UPI001E68A6DE|nr:uncharacterized protein LOC123875067 isoform X1 [Maniola jurtina]
MFNPSLITQQLSNLIDKLYWFETMILNYNLFLNLKFIILLYVFKANAVVVRSDNLSRNKIHYIDNTAEDNHVINEKNYGKMNQTEDVEVENCTNYNYDYLVKEYDNDDKDVIESNWNTTYTENSLPSNCSVEERSSWKSIRFSLYDVWSRKQTMILSRLWKIVKVWFVIYLVVAVPLWCTRGWCCCCLFCKSFKPTQTIDEAKMFLEANPPGVLQDKKGGIIFYEPTSNERECYEKFGHLIRTI